MGLKGAALITYKTGFREPPSFNESALLQQITLELVAQGGSDIYFMSGYPVLAKVHGRLVQMTDRRLTTPECLQIVNWAAGTEQAAGRLAQGLESKSSYNSIHPTERDSRGEKRRFRFRSNAIRCEYRGAMGVQIVMRAIRSEPPRVADIGLEEEIVRASTPETGVIYVTGATGMGKSTTFSGMVRRILEEDTPIKGNILTIEEPIEYVFDDIDSSHSVVAQSEVGRDVQSFDHGVISAMRHDPSLIVVGETRDEPTASAVLKAALTGHPCYTTVHVNDVPSVFSRMLSFYPPEVRHTMLYEVVDSSRLLINQRLVPSLDGKRVPLREYLVMTASIREQVINSSDPQRIVGVMRECLHRHGKTMGKAAQEAYERGLISEEVMRINMEA